MMNTSLNLAALPKCNYEVMYLDSAVLIPCVEYQRELRDEKIHSIAANFSEYIANEPKVSWRGGRYYVFDGQNTIEARKACNGGMDLPILCKVFTGLTKEDEAILFAVQTGFSTELTAGERLRADLVAQDPDALAFAAPSIGADLCVNGLISRHYLSGSKKSLSGISSAAQMLSMVSTVSCPFRRCLSPEEPNLPEHSYRMRAFCCRYSIKLSMMRLCLPIISPSVKSVAD